MQRCRHLLPVLEETEIAVNSFSTFKLMNKKNRQIKAGIFLMIFSGVFFGLMLLTPFLELPTKPKVFWSSASFIAMEVCFWGGGLLVGKELFNKYKSQLNPAKWFNNKSPS